MSNKKKIIIGVVIGLLVLLVAGRVVSYRLGAKQADVKLNYIPVNAQTVKKKSITTTITISGKVQADKEVYVMPKTPGKVEFIAVKVGDVVKKDQVLFSLDKSDVQSSYDQAAAAYQLAQANYQLTKEKIDNAKIQLERYRELYKTGAVSKAELEQMELAASDASLQAAEAQLEQARAAYDSAAKVLSDMDVKSPISGIVTALNVDIGDMATNTASAATVVDMERVYVNVSVSEKVINQIKEGQEVLVEIPAASNRSLKGKIENLSLAADARTGKYSLKIYIDNRDHVIKPGMFARVTIDTARKDNVLVVPTDSVIFHSGKYVAYVIEDNKAVEREVVPGLENGKEVEIVSGLSEGEIQIVKGMNYVKDGSLIKIVELDGKPAAGENPADSGNEGSDAEKSSPDDSKAEEENNEQEGGGAKK